MKFNYVDQEFPIDSFEKPRCFFAPPAMLCEKSKGKRPGHLADSLSNNLTTFSTLESKADN